MANPSGGTPRRTPRGTRAWWGVAGCWGVFVLTSTSAGHERVGFPVGRLLLGAVSFAGGVLLLLVARGRAHRPARTTALCALLGVAAVFVAVLVTAAHDSATRSANVQHHGLRVHGTVTSVQETTRTDVSETHGERTRVTGSVITVQLDEELQGRQRTTVRTSGPVAYRKGSGLVVLVDPRDVGYAELPGHAASPSAAWVLLLGGALLAWTALVVGVLRTPAARSDAG